MNNKITLIVTLALLWFAHSSYGQSQHQVDSIANEICNRLKAKGELPRDSAVLMKTLEDILFEHIAFVQRYPEETWNDMYTRINYRAQRNCREFSELVAKIFSPDWVSSEVSVRPNTALSKRNCNDFFERHRFKYLELSGDTTEVEIANGYYIETFKDGTVSKLLFKRLSSCEFEIEFVESNNKIRKDVSAPGDKYRYALISRTADAYKVSVETVGINRFQIFEFYTAE